MRNEDGVAGKRTGENSLSRCLAGKSAGVLRLAQDDKVKRSERFDQDEKVKKR
jgi:hypothetical protein